MTITDTIVIKAPAGTKARWIKLAGGKKLSDWVVETVNNGASHGRSGMICELMDLANLAEKMAPNGDPFPSVQQARAMRSLLVANADAFGWRRLSDVEDTDWFRMLDQAMGTGQ